MKKKTAEITNNNDKKDADEENRNDENAIYKNVLHLKEKIR